MASFAEAKRVLSEVADMTLLEVCELIADLRAELLEAQLATLTPHDSQG